MNGRPVTPAEADAWQALYTQGSSLRAIAAQYDREHKTVLYALRRAGVTIRSRSCNNHPPRQPVWIVDYCPACGEERRINPRSGWCWHCTTLTAARRHGYSTV